MMKIQQKECLKHYCYPEEVLNYILAMVPNDIKDDILEDWYKVLLKEFCEPLQMNYCNVSMVVVFGMFIGKSLQQKFFL